VVELRARAAREEVEAVAIEIERARRALPRLEADVVERRGLRADGFTSRRGLERAEVDLEQARTVVRLAETRAGVARAEVAAGDARRVALDLERREIVRRALALVQAELDGGDGLATGAVLRRP
jgi:multidrug resistance efflux pump